jgi:DUF1680 family protein
VAIQRGPIVYCLEEADNGEELSRLQLPANAALEAAERTDLLGRVVVIHGMGVGEAGGPAGANAAPAGELYSRDDGRRPAEGSSNVPTAKDLLFIPYYAWANRTPGEMAVWIRE